MQRRDFLGGVALGGVALASPSRADAARPIPEPEVDAFLQELDRDLARMSKHSGPRPLRRFLAKKGLRPGLLGETFATVQLASEWHDSSEAVRNHPGFQERLIQRASRLGPDLAALTEVIGGLPRPQRERARRLLRRPNRSMRVLDEGFFQKSDPMMRRRRGHLRRNLGLAAKAAGSTESGDVFDRLVTQLDQVCEEAGTTRGALAQVDVSSLGAVDMTAFGEHLAASGAASASDSETSSGKRFRELDLRRSEDMGRFGLRLLGIAAAALVGGILLIVVGAEVLGTILTAFVMPILLVVALVVFLVALVMYIRESTSMADRELEHRLSPLLADLGPLPT